MKISKLDVLDKNLNVVSQKTINIVHSSKYLNKWISRPKANKDFAIPLKNTLSPAYSSYHSSCWSDNAIGYFFCNGNDMTASIKGTCLLSSVYSNPHGMYVNAKNLLQVAMVYAVRRTKQYSWDVKADTFYQPFNTPSSSFALDCLIFMLFDGMNLSASSIDLEWGGVKYDLINHFIPFSEVQVGCPTTFKSNFMSSFLANILSINSLSTEAQEVYDEGLVVWKDYFKGVYTPAIIEKYHLYTPDVGWYQISGATGAKLKTIDKLKLKIRQQAIVEGFVR
jgi:hypothetical protein